MRRNDRPLTLLAAALPALMLTATGCGPDFRYLRIEGQSAMREGRYAEALDHFRRAYEKQPGNAQNLYDLGQVYLHYGRRKVDEGNQPAALRDLDRSIGYFSQAIEAHPGMQAAILAKNEALELQGRYDDALAEVEWASAFIGPAAREQILLAREFEERGDYDTALLRFRQAVAMERRNPTAHAEFAQFLKRRGHREMAIRHFEIAYRLKPTERGVAAALTAYGQPLPRTVDAVPAPGVD